ncbi:MAG TPA: DUF3099 domain-containing protein [Jatrophihabitantaceae bacterium]|nr:DUF3099 domain-containing protein [Jatrophihabitantaceae bacterium]
MRRTHGEPPVLITSAPQSPDDEYDRRRKRYAIMMAGRAACVIAAASVYRVSIVLAIAFVFAGTVLPWAAVIMANDRPPKKRRAKNTYRGPGGERALPAGADDDRVVDG